MKIAFRQEHGFIYRALQLDTYQMPFPETTPCVHCKKEGARPLMVIDDDEGLIPGQRPPEDGIWPHDCSAIALYLCPDCGEITAKWNQG